MKYTVLFVILVLFLVACSPAQPAEPAAPEPAAPEPTVAAPASEPVVIQPGPTPVEAKPTPAISKELDALLKKADQKIKSYQYLELILPHKKQPDTISIRGTKIKITLYEYDPYIPGDYFDTVYLDTSTKTIIGRCESQKRCIWPRGDSTTQEWTDLDYSSYRPKTPYEWVKEVPHDAEILGPEVHDKRQTTKIQFSEAGKITTMWIDDTYGIPLEIVVKPSTGEEVIYKFNDPQFNTIVDSDVTPREI